MEQDIMIILQINHWKETNTLKPNDTPISETVIPSPQPYFTDIEKNLVYISMW